MVFYVNKRQRRFFKKRYIKKIFKRVAFFLLYLIIFLCLLFFVFCGKKLFNFLLVDKNFFYLEDIKINIIDNDEKVVLKNNDFIKDIYFGDNLFLLKIDRVKDYFYRNFDNIEYIDIKKFFPHRLIINVYPKKKLFLVKDDGKKFLDEKGFIFNSINNLIFDLKTIYDLKVDTKNFDKNGKDSRKKILAIEKFVKELMKKDYNFFSDIKSIAIDDDLEISFFYKNKYVLFGKLKKNLDIFQKIKYLELAIIDFESKNLKEFRDFSIDVSDFVVYTNKKNKNHGKMIFSYKDF